MPTPRDIDAESGINRTRPRGKPRKPKRSAPIEREHEASEVESDSDVQSELDKDYKDDSRRPVPRTKKADTRTQRFKANREDAKHSTPIAPHMLILSEPTKRISLSTIQRPATSEYIPCVRNMFVAVRALCNAVCDNIHIHKVCPEFFTPAIYLFYSHVVYFQILRAREAAGGLTLTRFERRALASYQRIGPLESWNIAGPLIGFVHSLGCVKSPDPYYSWIVPKVPDFSRLTAGRGLTGLSTVPGMGRLPVIPAQQQFLNLFANSTAQFHNEVLIPCLNLSVNNQFIGLSSSSATDADFQSLANNVAWLEPREIDATYGTTSTATKRSCLQRWSIPSLANTADLTSLEAFLGIDSNADFDWLSRLLPMAKTFSEFFLGSETLLNISPFSSLGALTHVTFSRSAAPEAADDVWYNTASGVKVAFKGFTNTPEGNQQTLLGIATSTNCEFTNYFSAIAADFSPSRTGPFFVDDPDAATNRERRARFLCKGSNQEDPADRFGGLLYRYYLND
ncbi:hypothetical protein F5Y08DRAFT_300510 [Xylaria arbuscula]|nr:hypothetical protein F5Y08DRAFT_300510 [Xylaria arbuscula]